MTPRVRDQSPAKEDLKITYGKRSPSKSSSWEAKPCSHCLDKEVSRQTIQSLIPQPIYHPPQGKPDSWTPLPPRAVIYTHSESHKQNSDVSSWIPDTSDSHRNTDLLTPRCGNGPEQDGPQYQGKHGGTKGRSDGCGWYCTMTQRPLSIHFQSTALQGWAATVLDPLFSRAVCASGRQLCSSERG